MFTQFILLHFNVSNSSYTMCVCSSQLALKYETIFDFCVRSYYCWFDAVNSVAILVIASNKSAIDPHLSFICTTMREGNIKSKILRAKNV